MVKLTDLDPRWLIDDGRKVGFVFKSPTNGEWWQTCFFEAGRKVLICHDPECYRKDEWCCPHSQTGLARAAGVDPSKVQGCERDCAWAIHGPLDFSVLTITPSIDGSKGGLWHGFITNGQIVGGIP